MITLEKAIEIVRDINIKIIEEQEAPIRIHVMIHTDGNTYTVDYCGYEIYNSADDDDAGDDTLDLREEIAGAIMELREAIEDANKTLNANAR